MNHSTVRQIIYLFSKFPDTIRENLISTEISQNVKHDLQKILAWFIIDYFVHSIDFIPLSRKSFRSEISDNRTLLADQTDYVWDPDWSHPSFLNIPTDISCEAKITNSVSKDHIRITSLTIDATPLNYIAMFTERTANNSLNFTFINTQETLNGTRSLTQQDIQTPSHFLNEETVETMPTTTQHIKSYLPFILRSQDHIKTTFPQ